MAAKAPNIAVTLDGDRVEFECTVGALETLCIQYGDLRTVQQRITSVDFRAIRDVVIAAVPAAQSLSVDKVGQAIFETGLLELIDPVSKYITRLANGGRDPSDTPAKSEGKSPNAK